MNLLYADILLFRSADDDPIEASCIEQLEREGWVEEDICALVDEHEAIRYERQKVRYSFRWN